jgi:hypothetical protein
MPNDGMEGVARPEAERARQEREVALRHLCVEAEFALAAEAVSFGQVLHAAGVGLDATTFLSVRLVEAAVAAGFDPVEVLSWMLADGMLERAASAAARDLPCG